MKTLFQTDEAWSSLILRVMLAIVMFPHGAQKLLGWFGGYGFSGTMGFFTGTMHLPWLIGFLVIIIEFFGSLSLIAGFASRLWSVLVIIEMFGAVITTHLNNGFFMNWAGTQKGEGYEFHLLLIGLALAILINGSGKFS